MKIQEIVDRLTILGLDQGEAAVYVHLSMMGPSKASDVAAALRMHRTETYRTLQNLVQRGFASATLSRPQRFQAAPPERLFQEILSAQQARSENIQRAQLDIGPALGALRSQTGLPSSKNTFKVLQGRREIYAVLERMARDAHQSIRALSTHEGAVAMGDLSGILELVGRRADEGVEVRLILRTTPATRSRLLAMPDAGRLSLRHLDTDRIIRFVLQDETALLLWVVSDPSTRLTSEEDVAIWTDAVDFVGTQSVLFDAVWREAKDVRTLAASEGITSDNPGVRR